VYPAAWPQAKKHPFVQLVFKCYETIKCLYVIKKVGFRYRQAETAGIAAVDRLERTAGLASAVRWLRKAHVAKHFGVEKPTQKLRSFFSRWSIKFSAEYYEAKERQASGIPQLNSSKRTGIAIESDARVCYMVLLHLVTAVAAFLGTITKRWHHKHTAHVLWQRCLEVASRLHHVGVVDETRRTYRHHGRQRDAPRRTTFRHATLRVAPHRYATLEPLGKPGRSRAFSADLPPQGCER
jgi:hypothetical protein